MAASVAGQEDGLGGADPAKAQGVGRFAPGGCDFLLPYVLKTRQVVDARPADDPDNRLRHAAPSPCEICNALRPRRK